MGDHEGRPYGRKVFRHKRRMGPRIREDTGGAGVTAIQGSTGALKPNNVLANQPLTSP